MARSLDSHGAKGGFITILGQMVKISIQVVSVTILSRLLDPEDFGLIAMTSVFISLGALFRDFGIPTAALQVKELSNQQASNLFWINTAIGTLIASLLVVATPLIADFYDEDKINALVPLMAISVIIGGLNAQYQIQLARSMKFVALTFSGIISQVAGIVVAIVGALLGAGFWALAAQMLVTSAVLLLVQSISSRWIPLRPRKGAETRRILKLGLSYGGSHFLTYSANQVDSLAIGARWGAMEVGEYNRAFQLLSMPVQSMMAPLTNVVIPTVNRAQNHGKTIDSMLLRIQFLVGTATVWIFVLAISTADFTILLLLGPGWDTSIFLFQILAIGGMFHVFSFVSYWGFMLYDQGPQLLRYNLVTKTITVLAIAGSSLISVEAVAIAYSSSLLISWPINLLWLNYITTQDSWAYFRNGVRILLAAGVSVVCGLLLFPVVENLSSAFISFLVVATSVTLIYLSTLVLAPGGRREVADAVGIARLVVQRDI